MGLGDIADGALRAIEGAGAGISEALFEPVIRLGVTGLSRSGKTVFITSLVANLLERGRMAQFRAAHGAIHSAFLQPQPNDAVPRFDYERHLSRMTGPDPDWPRSTRSVSQLRLSFRVQHGGLRGITGPRTVHLDIVDYPGEWLLDLPLLDLSYDDWSRAALAKAKEPGRAALSANYLALELEDGGAAFDEPRAQVLSAAFTAYLAASREAGFSACTPGRFLMPGELEGSPALTFSPLPRPDKTPRGCLWREMERRFEAYKAQVVKPFFRNHFAGIDRQVVLVDVLGAIHAGPRAVEDLRGAMAEVLAAFRPGRNSWLSTILGRRVEKILFAATKADHLHHAQHPQLTSIMSALVDDARRRADWAGAVTGAISIAALRATTEDRMRHEGQTLDVVRGQLLEAAKPAAFFPGLLPSNPSELLTPAAEGAQTWLDADYQVMRFAPAPNSLRPGAGPPHIRLDKAAEFLLGDRL